MQKNKLRRLIALFSAFTVALLLAACPATSFAMETEGNVEFDDDIPAPVAIDDAPVAMSGFDTPQVAGMLRAPLASPLQDPTAVDGEMTDVELTDLTINGEPSAYIYRYDAAVLEVTWEWNGADQVMNLADGAYFDIELPTQFVYDGYSETALDADGNAIRLECILRASDSRYVLRTTYTDVNGIFNLASGKARVTMRPRADLVINGSLTTDVTLRVTNGTQDKAEITTQVTIDESPKTLAGNEWVVRYKEFRDGHKLQHQTSDYIANPFNYFINIPTNSARLYVAANHWDDLIEDPFHDQNLDYDLAYLDNVVDFEPNVSNYLDTYCADMDNDNRPGGNYTRGLLQPGMPYQVGDKELTDVQVDRLIRLLSVSYPYVSLEEMYATLNDPEYTYGATLDMFDEETAVTVVQALIWETIHNFYGTDFYNGKGVLVAGDRTTQARQLEIALSTYAYWSGIDPVDIIGSDDPTTYDFVSTPVLKFSDGIAQVSGSITPVTNADRLTGTFASGDKEVTFTIDDQGYFTAELEGVSRHDSFSININGTVPGKTDVWYFTSLDENEEGEFFQNMIGCARKKRQVDLHWNFEGFFDRTVRIVKVDGERPDKTLYGAEFTLYETLDGVVTDDMEPFGVYETNFFGEARMRGLIDGAVYVLIETRAPKGYTLPEPVIPTVFHIEEINGVPCVVIDSSAPEDAVDGGVKLLDNNTMGIRVNNQITPYVIPETGGVGRMPFAVTGALMMAFAATGLLIRRRYGKRGERA